MAWRPRGIGIVEGDVARLSIEADKLTGVEMADGKAFPRAAL
jgi:hypothetical protein